MSDTKRKAGKIFRSLKGNGSLCKHEYSGKLNDPKSASADDIRKHYLSIRPKLDIISKTPVFMPVRHKAERRINKGRRSTDRQDLN